MSDDIRELYQQVILDHNKSPKNFHEMKNHNRKADGFNPLCGDKLTLFLDVKGERIAEASFVGSGCAISKASASLMTEAITEKSLSEVRALFEKFHHLVTSRSDAEAPIEGLGKLAVFAGVREYPARVKCASLAWHTLCAAIENQQNPVSTE